MSRWERLRIRALHMGPYEVVAVVLIALAIGLRLFFLAIGLPEVNSDEGTMGVEAIHIAFQGQHPVFLYGQDYMGVLEAYIAAFFFHLFGVSSFTLRLGMVIMFLGFLVTMYCLTSLLYSKKLALVTLALLGLGAASDVMIQQLRAVGGAIETLLFGSLVLMLAVWLALSEQSARSARSARSAHSRRLVIWRQVAYAGWGLAAGLGLWTHLLVAPFVLAGGAILLVFCRRELFSYSSLLLILFLVIGLMPFIIYNLQAPPGHNTLVQTFSIQKAASLSGAATPNLLMLRISGTTLWSLPVATGLTPACALTALPYYGPATSATTPCVLAQGSWSLGYLALLTIAAALALLGLWKLWQLRQLRRARMSEWSQEESETARIAAIIHFSRLMVLSCAAITLLLYFSSPLSGLKPWSTRYLVGLLVTVPAVLWPLWNAAGFEKFRLPGRAKIVQVVCRGVLVVMTLAILAGTVATFTTIPGVIADNQQQEALVQDLLSIGATHVYSGYWTGGYRLVFQSEERIISAVPGGLTEPGGNRYKPYIAIVASDPNATFVFQQNSPDAIAFAKRIAHSSTRYKRYNFGIYVVYQPVTALSHQT